ncbi:MAG: hypothetical protein KDJ35_03625 [Alphaproteobacteria bacterium]|nr:hypothetical protein [Alphaproteobacteria bacterium]
MRSRKSDIEIFHRINKLKKKAGLSLTSGKKGVVDPNAVARAQETIDEKEREYPPTVKELIGQITTIWKSIKDMPEEEQKQALETLYHLSNNIKDITETYDHNLMHHFALSLRDFCEIIDLGKPQHSVIVQAHLDVMLVTFEEKLKSDETAQAEELKNIVKIAIEKYS